MKRAGGNVEELSRLVIERSRPEGGRLLHVAGSDVAGDLAGLLREAGFAIERIVLYEARPAAAFSPPAGILMRCIPGASHIVFGPLVKSPEGKFSFWTFCPSLR